MIIKLSDSIKPIWINTDKILYITILPETKWSRIWLIELDNPFDVIETPDEIMELIKKG